jgi:molecular chaperone GrpE (heat shock protein)
MTDKAPKPAIVPFLIGDMLLLALAGGIVYQTPLPLGLGHLALCTAAVAVGAWLLVTPFIMLHRAELKLAEADTLRSTVAQIENLEQIKDRIVESTSAWTNIQGECSRTVASAKEVADGMASEAKAFAEFMQKANDMEKATLRLEADKLRRMEGEWLQVQVRTLDHVYALYVAGTQSGQPNLIHQLGQFQNACRDAARRMGLAPFAPEPGEVFNPELHQPANPDAPIPAEPRIAQTLATGFNYQGRMLRPAMVLLASEVSAPVETAPAESAPEPSAPAENTAEEFAPQPPTAVEMPPEIALEKPVEEPVSAPLASEVAQELPASSPAAALAATPVPTQAQLPI